MIFTMKGGLCQNQTYHICWLPAHRSGRLGQSDTAAVPFPQIDERESWEPQMLGLPSRLLGKPLDDVMKYRITAFPGPK